MFRNLAGIVADSVFSAVIAVVTSRLLRGVLMLLGGEALILHYWVPGTILFLLGLGGEYVARRLHID